MRGARKLMGCSSVSVLCVRPVVRPLLHFRHWLADDDDKPALSLDAPAHQRQASGPGPDLMARMTSWP